MVDGAGDEADWTGGAVLAETTAHVSGSGNAWKGPSDAAFAITFRHTVTGLSFLLRVTDDEVRTGPSGESFSAGAASFTLQPGGTVDARSPDGKPATATCAWKPSDGGYVVECTVGWESMRLAKGVVRQGLRALLTDRDEDGETKLLADPELMLWPVWPPEFLGAFEQL